MTFTVNHGIALLALLANLDPRHNGTDPATIQGKAETWSKVLDSAGADPQWVKAFVERAYSDPRPVPLYVGDIKRGWDNYRRVEAAKERPEPVLFGSTRAPEGFAAMVEQSRQRWAVARQAPAGSELWAQQREAAQVADAGMTVGWTVLAVKDERERRCVEHQTCLCTHTECRDGWLDRETPEGRVQRCPVCREATEMRTELAPKRRGRR